MKPQR